MIIHEMLPLGLFISNGPLPFSEKIIVKLIATDNDKGLHRGQALFQVSPTFSSLIMAIAL